MMTAALLLGLLLLSLPNTSFKFKVLSVFEASVGVMICGNN
jgi:hypothetical protein